MATDVREPLHHDDEGTGDAEIAILKLSGELDMRYAPELIATGTRRIASATSGVLVELSDVTFMDSTALGALVNLRNEAASQGKTLLVANPQPAVRRVFELTNLADYFGIAD